MRSGSSYRSDTRRLQEDKQQSSPLQYLIAFSLTTNLNLRLSTPIYCHQHSSPSAVPRTALARICPCMFTSALIFPCAFASSLTRSHLLLCTRIYPPANLSWLSIVAQSSLSHLAIHLWAIPHRRTLLAIHPQANLIAGLCLRSTLGQTSLQDFTRDPPLTKPHCRTLPAIHPWST